MLYLLVGLVCCYLSLQVEEGLCQFTAMCGFTAKTTGPSNVIRMQTSWLWSRVLLLCFDAG
jgi:hypothetical protein